MAEKQSVLGRVTALAQADVQTLIDDSADPEALFLALGRAFTTTIAEAEDALASALATKRLTEHDRAEDQQTADDWGIHAATAAYHAAELRIEGNMSGAAVFDDLARTALERQLTTERAVADAAGVVAALASYVDTLREQLDLAKDQLSLIDERRAHQIGHLEPEDGRILDPETAEVLDPDTELRTFEEKLLREDERQTSTLDRPSYLDGRFAGSVDPALRSEVERRLELLRPDEDELVAALAARASAEAERVADEAERIAAQAQQDSADVLVDDEPIEDVEVVEAEPAPETEDVEAEDVEAEDVEADSAAVQAPAEEPEQAVAEEAPADDAPAEDADAVETPAEVADADQTEPEPTEPEPTEPEPTEPEATEPEPVAEGPAAAQAAVVPEPVERTPEPIEDERDAEPEVLDDVETNVVVEQDAIEPLTAPDETVAAEPESTDTEPEDLAPEPAGLAPEPVKPEPAEEPAPDVDAEPEPEPEPRAVQPEPVEEGEHADGGAEPFMFREERSRPVGGRRRANVPVKGPDDDPVLPTPAPAPPADADEATVDPSSDRATDEQPPAEQDPEPPRPQGFSMHANDPFPRTNPLAGIADVEAAYRLARAQEETQWDLPAFVDEPEPGPSAFAPEPVPFPSDPVPFTPAPFAAPPSAPGPFAAPPTGRDEDELPTAEYPAIRFDTFGGPGPASAAAFDPLLEPTTEPALDQQPDPVTPEHAPADGDGDALARRRARRSRETRSPGVPTAYDIAYDPTQGPAHPSFLDPPGARGDSGDAQVFPLRPRAGETPPDQQG